LSTSLVVVLLPDRLGRHPAGGRVFTTFSTHRTTVTKGCVVYIPGLAGRGCRTR
jgi:hypothetical protein